MKFIQHSREQIKAVEVVSDEILINSEQDALDIMANIDYQYNCRTIIISKNNINEAFFDLKTRLAGNILQKFSNYKVRLIITGDFSNYKSKSLQDFIFESNKNRLVLFLKDTESALNTLV